MNVCIIIFKQYPMRKLEKVFPLNFHSFISTYFLILFFKHLIFLFYCHELIPSKYFEATFLLTNDNPKIVLWSNTDVSLNYAYFLVYNLGILKPIVILKTFVKSSVYNRLLMNESIIK